jgi:hypothetical protein
MRFFVIPGLLLIVVLLFWNEPSEYSSIKQPRINGISLVSPPREIEEKEVSEVKRIHADWVAVIPYGFSREGQPEVTFDHQRQWWGEKTQGSCELIQLAQRQGLKVMLKPHIWVLGQGWAGDFNLSSEEDWEKWEADYRKYIINYGRVADSLNVDLLCIGTEFRIPARERPEFWRSLILDVRKIYKGPLTYAANWDNYQNIEWWDGLDFIGIDAYFPLVDAQDPSLEEISAGWRKHSRILKSFSEKWQKKILFTEYGFLSVNGACGNHWEAKKTEENINFELQARAYESTFQTLINEPWFAGGFIWKWHFSTRRKERLRTEWTPQDKPAEKVIAQWYAKFQ